MQAHLKKPAGIGDVVDVVVKVQITEACLKTTKRGLTSGSDEENALHV